MELSKLTDYQLVKKIKKFNDSDAYLELKRRNEKGYYRVCERYTKKVPALKYSELVEDVDYLLNKSIQTYNVKKKTKFSSWVISYSRYHVLNTIKRLNEVGKFIPTENLEIDLLNNNKKYYHIDTKEELKDHIFSLLDGMKDKRARKIVELRFFSDKHGRKWKNIAREMNLSCQQVSNIYNTAKESLYENMIKEDNKK